jgi:hypothetical protein
MALPHVMEWPVAGDAATVPTRRPSMSALGQKQTYAPQQVMSALPPKKRTCAFQKLNHCTFATAEVFLGSRQSSGTAGAGVSPAIFRGESNHYPVWPTGSDQRRAFLLALIIFSLAS